MLAKLSIVVVSIFIIISLAQTVFGLNELSAKEKRCRLKPPPIAKDIDTQWAASVETYYVPWLSRLDLYRAAADLLHLPFEEIKEDELYYNGCFRLKLGQKPYFTGFHGKKEYFDMTPISVGNLKFRTDYLKAEITSYVTLTDNKTFQFFYNCFDDGEATWTVLSPKKSLDKATEKKIFEHAKSLGFNPKFFTQMRMETCGKEGKSKEEL